MLPTPETSPPPVALLLILADPPGPGLDARLDALRRALPEAELRVSGHGAPDRLAPALRALARRCPEAKVELATHPLAPTATLVAAVRAAKAPWLIWLPARAGTDPEQEAQQVAALWSRAGETPFRRAPGGACLFRREALLQLPRIPGMVRLLPELFALCGAAPSGAVQPASAAGRIRRAYVALACTMGLGWTPPRRTA